MVDIDQSHITFPSQKLLNPDPQRIYNSQPTMTDFFLSNTLFYYDKRKSHHILTSSKYNQR